MNGQQVQLFLWAVDDAHLCNEAPALLALAYAFAAANGRRRAPLPWERPMTAKGNRYPRLTGPVAAGGPPDRHRVIAGGAGAMLWGGELTEFIRWACMIGSRGLRPRIRGAPCCSSAFGGLAGR